ncbi:MAG: hypothetical protein JAY66_12890 [Candidatus Thiodiazotropha taylori]|nr:hypothetical protein [Candidatus Thiodiazotropha taylori]
MESVDQLEIRAAATDGIKVSNIRGYRMDRDPTMPTTPSAVDWNDTREYRLLRKCDACRCSQQRHGYASYL